MESRSGKLNIIWKHELDKTRGKIYKGNKETVNYVTVKRS